jgi:hypothetical protein
MRKRCIVCGAEFRARGGQIYCHRPCDWHTRQQQLGASRQPRDPRLMPLGPQFWICIDVRAKSPQFGTGNTPAEAYHDWETARAALLCTSPPATVLG